jgi:hypothetical protein
MGLDEIVKLGLEKGFFFPSAEIYSNAPAGFWNTDTLALFSSRSTFRHGTGLWLDTTTWCS